MHEVLSCFPVMSTRYEIIEMMVSDCRGGANDVWVSEEMSEGSRESIVSMGGECGGSAHIILPTADTFTIINYKFYIE